MGQDSNESVTSAHGSDHSVADAERSEFRSTEPLFPPASDAPRRKTSLLAKLTIAVASLVVSLVLAELVVRVFFTDEVDGVKLMARLKAGSIKDIKQPSSDPLIGFEARPNLHWNGYGPLFITDADGHRIPKHPVKVPKNAVRIAVLGDSSSFGWGVDYEYSYPYLYREEMSDIAKVPIAMTNFSVPAYSSVQEARVFHTKVLPYKPDLVILHHDNNDASPPLALWRSDECDGLHPTYGDNALHSALIKLTARKVMAYRLRHREGITLPYDRNKHEYVGPGGGYIASGPLYDEHLAALREIAGSARSNGIPLIVVLFEAYMKANERYEQDPVYVKLHKRLVDELTPLGAHVLDLYPAYQRKMRELGWSDLTEWWVDKELGDPHPNAAGHRFITRQLVEFTRAKPELMDVFRPTRGPAGSPASTASSSPSGPQ